MFTESGEGAHVVWTIKPLQASGIVHALVPCLFLVATSTPFRLYSVHITSSASFMNDH